MKKFYIFFMILAIAGLLQSCGSSYVSVPVTKPSEVNLIKYKNVCVGEFGGHKAGNNINAALTNYLTNSGKVNVLDRQNLDKILRENELTLAGLSMQENNAKVVKLLGAAVMISGQILNYTFNEELQKGPSYMDKKGKKHQDYTTVGTAKVKINFKIIDLTTSKILFSRDFETTAVGKNSSTDQFPPHVKDDEQLSIAREEITKNFTKCILPYTERLNVEFLTDSDLPALEEGVDLIRNGSWDEGIRKFQSAIEAAKDGELLAKAYYDLGLGYQYTYAFDKAHEAFGKACSASKEQKYINAATKCRAMEEEQRRLESQLKEGQS